MTNPLPISPVPTEADVRAAHLAKLDAWSRFIQSEGKGENEWADYMLAIEHHADLQFQHEQAVLRESGICSI